MGSEDGRKWRYTWEAQSHVPTLRLLLFNRGVNPSLHCQNLKVHLQFSRSLVAVSWFEDGQVSVRVPFPKVLVDSESPISFRALDDHIEVKLVLLLPVDHPIVSRFDSVLNLSENEENVVPDVSKPLVMEYDTKSLSARGEVHFYCRNCSFKLTRSPIKSFVEMPSVNWREVADNWFGACCCSFGSISDKLVIRYANSYACALGTCLLSCTSVTLCKDDLVECNFADWHRQQECNSKADISENGGINKATLNSGLNVERASSPCSNLGEMSNVDKTSRNCDVKESNQDGFSHAPKDRNVPEDAVIAPSCCAHTTTSIPILGNEDTDHHLCETGRQEQRPIITLEIQENQKSFLNGFLGDVFMARLSHLSEKIEWVEFFCPQCKSLLGAYPCFKGSAPVDGGTRLFKCYISTCVPVGGSGDLFRKYTIERMFTNQLVECANDESSFRFVARDLKTKSPVLQIILINPDTWSYSGICSCTEDIEEPVSKLQLLPVIKVLFSDCGAATESQLRMVEEWVAKNSAESIYMLTDQTEQLIGILISAKDMYPPSYVSVQGLSLSFLQR